MNADNDAVDREDDALAKQGSAVYLLARSLVEWPKDYRRIIQTARRMDKLARREDDALDAVYDAVEAAFDAAAKTADVPGNPERDVISQVAETLLQKRGRQVREAGFLIKDLARRAS